MQRVLVIGSGGSGKTTVARLLAERLQLPLIHLDTHYWRPLEGARAIVLSTQREVDRFLADLVPVEASTGLG